jgi:hypothetical protein
MNFKSKNAMPTQLTEMKAELTRMRKENEAPIKIKELNRKYNRLMTKWLNTL